mmetsp:Transcript_5259/g.10110  ORF Transcript_5259/g.10110 Transcript_5259/m.10110 type:complete len:601 (+) Transcript_5259:55-1857(+)
MTGGEANKVTPTKCLYIKHSKHTTRTNSIAYQSVYKATMKAVFAAVARRGRGGVVSSRVLRSKMWGGVCCTRMPQQKESSSSSFRPSAAAFSTVATQKSSSNHSNSTLPRTNISLLGAVNAGKSVLMNLLTQSEVSIVHQTAGTTADPKTCLMELHGTIGPVRLFDTPGINEQGELGGLKREKAFQTIGQSDVALLVADPFVTTSIEHIAELLRQVAERQERNQKAVQAENKGTDTTPPRPLLVYNLRSDRVRAYEQDAKSVSLLIDDFEKDVLQRLPQGTIFPPTLAVDLQVPSQRDRVISFLEQHASARRDSVSLLPDTIQETHSQGYSPTVFLNIPMDQQTPSMRLLRPQAMVQEALIRNFVSTYCYRMDLGLARSDNPTVVQTEKDRFLRTLDPLLNSGDLDLLITDSQAMDIVAPWTLDNQGQEIVPITTFSITMIRYLSGGRLGFFADGLRQLDRMVHGQVSPKGEKWRILISEACNHTRLNMEKECADIGTVQLPVALQAVLGDVEVDFAFGKHVIFDPAMYDLVVHCGGCMLTPQQMDARMADLVAAGVPATNYGLLLSHMQSPATLARVLRPWGINYDDFTPTQLEEDLVV